MPRRAPVRPMAQDRDKGRHPMPATNTRLGTSHRALMDIVRTAPELRRGPALVAVLPLPPPRRRMDLTDLPPTAQAAMTGARAHELLPSVAHLNELLTTAQADRRQLVVKFGIDPTAADVHIGHAVPMIIASRFQRMGHRVVFIVGDITAR